MRNIKIAPNEYYHIFNRGMNKQNIFPETRDRVRFLFLILYFQSPVIFQNIGRFVKYYVKHRVFNIDTATTHETVERRCVELVAFCLMPNHFHLIIKEVEEGGIARYMQRVLNSYTKYFNAKYSASGHLFQGPYKAVHISSDVQLLYLSAYIHKNPTELFDWKNKEDNYEWSSYRDFFSENRWKELLVTDIITDSFENREDYRKFVQTSSAKKIEEEIEEVSINVKHQVSNTD